MKIELLTETEARAVATPDRFATEAIADGACPACGIEPFRVVGSGIRIVDDRYYEAHGFCLACMAEVGTIRADPGTLFGLADDQAVLGGPWKVF